MRTGCCKVFWRIWSNNCFIFTATACYRFKPTTYISMSDFDNLQRIIRLKRYETPGEDFVEDFVTRFQQRQRAELLRQSARGLLCERLTTFWENFVSPKWTAAAATACVAVVAAWGTLVISGAGKADVAQDVFASAQTMPAALSSQPALALESELIREVEQGRQLEIEGILLSRHFDSEEIIGTENTQLVGVSSAALPISAELQPLSEFIR